jgi:hypothetical protein
MLINDIFLQYSIVVTFVVFMLCHLILFSYNNQILSASAISVKNSYHQLAAERENYESYNSYFHYVDTFSDLSRNMTSSFPSDVFENNSSIGNNNFDSNTEDDSEGEDTADTDQ